MRHASLAILAAASALAVALLVPVARAEKPVVSIELLAVDANGDESAASPVPGITYLAAGQTAVMASYHAEGISEPCTLDGAWQAMADADRSATAGSEQGLMYIESPTRPGTLEFRVSCRNAEGLTTATGSWEFRPAPGAPAQPARFDVAAAAPAFHKAAASDIAIRYAIPGVGSSCIVWRERLQGEDWVEIEEAGFALYSLSDDAGISGSIGYSAPADAVYPYTERYRYSCKNPTLGYYADGRVIATVTHRERNGKGGGDTVVMAH